MGAVITAAHTMLARTIGVRTMDTMLAAAHPTWNGATLAIALIGNGTTVGSPITALAVAASRLEGGDWKPSGHSHQREKVS